MSKNIKLILGFFVLAVVIAVTAVLLWPSDKAESKISVPDREAQITITKDGFEPRTITVPAGTKVTWVNKDTTPHRVSSGVYPDDRGDFQFDSGKALPIGPDGAFSTTFTVEGSYDYYDNLKPTTSGKVIVEKEDN